MVELTAPEHPERKPLFSRFPIAQDRPVVRYLGAVVLSFLAYAVRAAVDGILPPGFPYVTFFPAVVLAAFFFGTWSGLLAAVLCGFLSWYYFIPPTHVLLLNTSTLVALGLYVFVVAVDLALIHWTQSAYRALERERVYSRAIAQNRELLFRELQHRVGNNLQMVGAMLRMQQRHVQGESAKMLVDASRRVALIGSVQRKLYDPDGQQIALGSFLREIGAEIVAAHGRDDIALSVHADEATVLPPSIAIPVAVIVAESIANAIEHGLAGRSGAITIRLAPQGSRCSIAVCDDGAGLPPDFDATRPRSFGLQLTSALAQQLGGTYSLARIDSGTMARLEFVTDSSAG